MWFKVDRTELDEAENVRFRFRNEAMLEATPDAIFDLLCAAERWPEWFPDFLSARYLTEPPHGVGSVREARLKTLSAKERFLAWEPGERWSFTLEAMSVPLVSKMVEDYRLEPVGDDRCRLVWTVYYQPRLALRPLHPIIRPIFGRMFKKAVASLEAYVRDELRVAA